MRYTTDMETTKDAKDMNLNEILELMFAIGEAELEKQHDRFMELYPSGPSDDERR